VQWHVYFTFLIIKHFIHFNGEVKFVVSSCLKLRSSRRCRQYGPQTRWYPITTLHSVTTQNTSSWYITAWMCQNSTRLSVRVSSSNFWSNRPVLDWYGPLCCLMQLQVHYHTLKICGFYCDSFHLRGPLAKFVDSPYYFESELCGGTVTVSFWKYLP
jgi:hypothetical protein